MAKRLQYGRIALYIFYCVHCMSLQVIAGRQTHYLIKMPSVLLIKYSSIKWSASYVVLVFFLFQNIQAWYISTCSTYHKTPFNTCMCFHWWQYQHNTKLIPGLFHVYPTDECYYFRNCDNCTLVIACTLVLFGNSLVMMQ